MLGIAKRCLENRSGATAVEYAMIVALVVLVLVTAVSGLGTQLAAMFGNVAAAFPA